MWPHTARIWLKCVGCWSVMTAGTAGSTALQRAVLQLTHTDLLALIDRLITLRCWQLLTLHILLAFLSLISLYIYVIFQSCIYVCYVLIKTSYLLTYCWRCTVIIVVQYLLSLTVRCVCVCVCCRMMFWVTLDAQRWQTVDRLNVISYHNDIDALITCTLCCLCSFLTNYSNWVVLTQIHRNCCPWSHWVCLSVLSLTILIRIQWKFASCISCRQTSLSLLCGVENVIF